MHCAPEAARLIIQERLSCGLSPRPNPVEFAAEILAIDIAQYDELSLKAGPTFFDRGLPDALLMLVQAGQISKEHAAEVLRARPYRKTVFFFPIWESIFSTHAERDQTLAEAVAVSSKLEAWYASLGFSLVEVPRVSVEERAEFMIDTVGAEAG